MSILTQQSHNHLSLIDELDMELLEHSDIQEFQEYIQTLTTDQHLITASDQISLLIQQEKNAMKADNITSPRITSKKHKRRDVDNISIASSNTSYRSEKKRRGRPPKNKNSLRKSLRTRLNNNNSDDDDEDDDLMVNKSKSSTPKYSWFNDDESDSSKSSSHDILLDSDFDIDTINISDIFTKKLNKKINKKKKHHKHKKDKHHHKKHKKSKKKKKKRKKDRHKINDSDDDDADYIISDDDNNNDDDDISDFDLNEYASMVSSLNESQLYREENKIIKLIEKEKNRLNHQNDNNNNNNNNNNMNDATINDDINKLPANQIVEKIQSRLAELTGKSYSAAEEDPSKLYCICRKPYDETTPMICCDYCQEWYHLPCIGLSKDKLASVEKLKFKCPPCNGANKNDIKDVKARGASFNSPKSSLGPRINNNNHPLIHKTRCSKYEKIIIELKNRLKNNKYSLKKLRSESKTKLNLAKLDIDNERKQRIDITLKWETTKNQSQRLYKELEKQFETERDNFKINETEFLNKLKKLEANKKKYKDSANENKKKLKLLKEEHNERVEELENDIIPSLKEQNNKLKNDKISLQKQINNILSSNNKNQTQINQIEQQFKIQMDNVKYQYTNLQKLYQLKINELIKIQNVNNQLNYKLNELSNNIPLNYNQWQLVYNELVIKIKRLTHNNQAIAIVTSNKIPSQLCIPSIPSYLKFNELEMEELKMCRQLCLKLLNANLFQVSHMASRIQLSEELFTNWVYSNSSTKQPMVINDLNTNNNNNNQISFKLNPMKHLSMNCIRHLLIEIRKQLESLLNDKTLEDATIKKVQQLLQEFQIASQEYEQKMQSFKLKQQQKLLNACSKEGTVIEIISPQIDSNGNTRDIWVKGTVIHFDINTQRVLYQKYGTKDRAYTTLDPNIIRLVDNENENNNNINNNTENNNNSNNNNSNNDKNTGILPTVMGGGFNNGQFNFNGMPTIPSFTTTNTNILPAFDQLDANLNNNNNNNNNTINLNGLNINTIGDITKPIIVDDNDDDNATGISRISRKSSKSSKSTSSRKRKRDSSKRSKKKNKKHKSSHSHDSSSDDSDSSSSDEDQDSDTDISSSSYSDDSDSDIPRSSKSNKKKHQKKKKKIKKKHSKKKKSKKKSKKKDKKDNDNTQIKRKRGRPKTRKDNNDDNRSISVSSATSLSNRKRRGTKRSLINGNSNGNPLKKRKLNSIIGNDGDYLPPSTRTRSISASINNQYETVGHSLGSSDTNDSVCRICKHPGDLVCCEKCPSAYHANCIRPRVKKNWLDKFEEWFCPACAPLNSYVPLKNKINNKKCAISKEPLLKDLENFLQKHPDLIQDDNPEFHPKRPSNKASKYMI